MLMVTQTEHRSHAIDSLNSSLPSQGLTPFTAAEKDWIKANPVITLALDEGNPPMNFREPSGGFSGISLDYMRVIAEKTGLYIQYQGSTWEKALRKAMNHEVDGIMTASLKKEREPFLNFTEPYMVTPLVLTTRKDFPEVNSINDFDGKIIAIVRGTVRSSIVKEHCPTSTILEVDSPNQGIKVLAEGKADAFFDDLPVVQHAINSNMLTNLKVALLYFSDAGAERVGLRNDSPELLAIFNKAIAAITSDEHREIRNRWLKLAEGASIEHELQLTGEEKAWLKTHPVIRVAVDPGWPPLEWRDSEGVFHGIAIEYLHRLEQMLDVRFEIIQNRSWQELMQMGRLRQADLFPCVAETSKRKEFLTFTEPYISTPIVLFSKAGAAYVQDFRFLAGKKVAVVQDYAAEDYIRDDHPSITLVPVKTMAEGLKLVSRDEVAYYVDGLLPTTYFLSQRGDSSIHVVGETPYVNNQRMAARSDWPELVPILQKALNAIPRAEHEAYQQKWVSLRYEHGFDYSLLKWFLGAFLLCLVFIVQLQFMVRRRTRELKDSKQLIQEILDNAFQLQGLITIDGRILEINKATLDFLGLEKSAVRNKYFWEVPGVRSLRGSIKQFKEAITMAGKGEFVRFDISLPTMSGELLDIDFSLKPIKDDKGRVVFLLPEGRDITERKQLEAQAIRTAHLASLGEMAAGVAHEINNPINGVINYAQIICNEVTVDSREHDVAVRIIKEGERIATIVRDLLTFAHDQGDAHVVCSIEETLADAMILCQSMINQEQVLVKMHLDANLPKVLINPQQIQQVFMNLLANACHALTEKYPGEDVNKILEISIKTITSTISPCLKVTFTDHGVGIQKELLEKILNPFFTTKPAGTGTGLGLSISHGIIKRHKGSVEIESEPGEYTRVMIVLPTANAIERT
jgi:PAS domain S-box-containing protein